MVAEKIVPELLLVSRWSGGNWANSDSAGTWMLLMFEYFQISSEASVLWQKLCWLKVNLSVRPVYPCLYIWYEAMTLSTLMRVALVCLPPFNTILRLPKRHGKPRSLLSYSGAKASTDSFPVISVTYTPQSVYVSNQPIQLPRYRTLLMQAAVLANQHYTLAMLVL